VLTANLMPPAQVNVTSAPANSPPRQEAPRAAWLVATCGGLGHLRPGPGTWTSAVTVVAWWAIARGLGAQWRVVAAVAITLLLAAIGIPAATSLARSQGKPDPSIVVIDEAAGQMLSLVAAPLQWKYLVVSFILFRGFDIFKPPPLRRLEKFPGGWGVMLDDLGAGLYALAVLQLLVYSAVIG
jgi:phosphatidylglycerophosphatase A